MRKIRPVKQRFFEKVKVGAPDQCWPWIASVAGNGYGKIFVNGRLQIASRVSWRIHHGGIPDSMHVLHKCDNPLCVNPAHLFLGTLKDNTTDMMQKCRHRTNGPVGERNRHAKLTAADVKMIRERHAAGGGTVTCAKIAKEYNVTEGAIRHIIRRHTWRHM